MRQLKNKPKVTIVGAGPGAIDLITVRGLRAVQSADVILYDALVNKELLEEAPSHALKIFVGKRAAIHYKTQDEINYLIVKMAMLHGHAVRLKGGDPFIFGRGYEELDYVRSFNLQVDVIPGLSSATSLAALQNVPLTSRGVSESFWVITGTTRKKELSRDITLAAQSTATMVVLMGIRKLPEICQILKENGKSDLPVMIIEKGASVEERVIVSTASDIVAKAKAYQIGTPGIIVAGEVVGLHPELIKEKVILKWNNKQQ